MNQRKKCTKIGEDSVDNHSLNYYNDSEMLAATW